ncbi:MAG: glycosyltransferase [Pseudomonadota bacterium]
MDTVRWDRMARALARQGHQVDIVLNRPSGTFDAGENLRYVSSGEMHWQDYDVIKTEFHHGFEHLERLGGADHPFIISKLGSVVGSEDGQEGVYFFGEERRQLFELQQRIARQARYVSILTQESIELWQREHGASDRVLFVPTGVDRELPALGNNPFADSKDKIAVYIGNIYDRETQPEINELWQRRMNSIGQRLQGSGVRLVMIGPGDAGFLDPAVVDYLGPIDNRLIYDYMQNADVGLVLAQGEIQHNESSKLYELIRCGVPVVSEAPVPNNHILEECNWGSVANYRDDDAIAAQLITAAKSPQSPNSAVNHILNYHTWDHRAAVYAELFNSE